MANIADWFNNNMIYCFRDDRACTDDSRVQYLYLMDDLISNDMGCAFIPEGNNNPLKTLPGCLSEKYGTDLTNEVKKELGWGNWTNDQVMEKVKSDKTAVSGIQGLDISFSGQEGERLVDVVSQSVEEKQQAKADLGTCNTEKQQAKADLGTCNTERKKTEGVIADIKSIDVGGVKPFESSTDLSGDIVPYIIAVNGIQNIGFGEFSMKNGNDLVIVVQSYYDTVSDVQKLNSEWFDKNLMKNELSNAINLYLTAVAYIQDIRDVGSQQPFSNKNGQALAIAIQPYITAVSEIQGLDTDFSGKNGQDLSDAIGPFSIAVRKIQEIEDSGHSAPFINQNGEALSIAIQPYIIAASGIQGVTGTEEHRYPFRKEGNEWKNGQELVDAVIPYIDAVIFIQEIQINDNTPFGDKNGQALATAIQPYITAVSGIQGLGADFNGKNGQDLTMVVDAVVQAKDKAEADLGTCNAKKQQAQAKLEACNEDKQNINNELQKLYGTSRPLDWASYSADQGNVLRPSLVTKEYVLSVITDVFTSQPSSADTQHHKNMYNFDFFCYFKGRIHYDTDTCQEKDKVLGISKDAVDDKSTEYQYFQVLFRPFHSQTQMSFDEIFVRQDDAPLLLNHCITVFIVGMNYGPPINLFMNYQVSYHSFADCMYADYLLSAQEIIEQEGGGVEDWDEKQIGDEHQEDDSNVIDDGNGDNDSCFCKSIEDACYYVADTCYHYIG